MKNIFLLLLAISFSACSKTERTRGTRLVSIDYSEMDMNWTEQFTYSSDSRLSQYEDSGRNDRRYEYSYKENRLDQVSTFDRDNRLIFRDSILYNASGDIEKIFYHTFNPDPNASLTLIIEYKYDDSNKLSTRTRFSIITQENFSTEQYFWDGENISKIEYYDSEDILRYEYFYEYDDKINYKRALQLDISDPINWTKNNRTEMDWNDHYGNLDIVCKPCIFDYRYNLDDYPVFINRYGGQELELTYE